MRLRMKSSSKMGTKFSSDSQKNKHLWQPLSSRLPRTCSLLLELASMVCSDSLQLCTNALHTDSTMWLQASQTSHLTIQIIVCVLCWVSWRLLTQEVCRRAEPLANKSREGRMKPGESKARLQFLIRKDTRCNQKMRHNRVHYSATASYIFCLDVCLCTTPMFPREPVSSHRQRDSAQFLRQSASCPCGVVSATPTFPYINHSGDS